MPKAEIAMLIAAAEDAATILGGIDNVPEYRRERARMALVEALSRVENEPTKCSPHDWAVPKIGDDGLTCQTCGRHLDFIEAMTGEMRASIVTARENHYGDAAGEEFRMALDAAMADARERYKTSAKRDESIKSAISMLSSSSSTVNRPDAPRSLPKRKRRV